MALVLTDCATIQPAIPIAMLLGRGISMQYNLQSTQQAQQ